MAVLIMSEMSGSFSGLIMSETSGSFSGLGAPILSARKLLASKAVDPQIRHDLCGLDTFARKRLRHQLA